MQTAFHHQDVPPQSWLDELHSLNILRVWDIQLSNNQRINLADRAQSSLNSWRVSLREQIKKIEDRYDASNRDTMKKTLMPYQMLDTLGNDLHTQLLDVMDRSKNGRAIPQGFEFGSRIFGDLQTKRWYLGEREDEQRWRDFMTIERRYQALGKEYKVQSRAYDNAKKRVKEGQNDLKNLELDYKQRTGFLQIGLRLFIVIVTILFCAVLGIVAFMNELPTLAIANEIFAGIMLILVIAGVISAIVIARHRREAIATLESSIAETREMLDSNKKEARRQRQYLLPTQQTLKEVRANYQVLKETF